MPSDPFTVAIVDLGSNTAKMSVFQLSPWRWYRQTDELREVVRLSAGSGASGAITPAAFERGLRALRRFRGYVDAAGVKEVHATATSAVRVASNGAELVAAIREQTGFQLRVISGEEEARHGALAAANSLPVEDALVLDVGGGSVQLSRLEGRRVSDCASWPLGSVAATERFLAGDPPSAGEVEALRAEIRAGLQDFLGAMRPKPKRLPLVGMGGTVRNLANLAIRAEGSPMGFMHGYRLRKRPLAKVVERLLGLKTAQRAQLDGLSADRADIIAAGAVVVHEVLKAAKAEAMLISGQGLREGLLYPLLLPGREPALVEDVRRFSLSSLAARLAGGAQAPGKPERVERLALALFDAQPASGRQEAERAFERELLSAAALLHEIGKWIDYRDHHKHGQQLIMNSPLNGYSHREQAIVALVVRYHRSGQPRANGLGKVLRKGDLERVARLAALLRQATELDGADSD